MICPKCKKQIDDDSKFCEFCGSEIGIQENRSDGYNKKIKELEGKVWFRIFKIVYILLFISSIVLGIALIYGNSYPGRGSIDDAYDEIMCQIEREHLDIEHEQISPCPTNAIEHDEKWWNKELISKISLVTIFYFIILFWEVKN